MRLPRLIAGFTLDPTRECRSYIAGTKDLVKTESRQLVQFRWLVMVIHHPSGRQHAPIWMPKREDY
jgi:hypothetical protein